jgi:hypothetical protein
MIFGYDNTGKRYLPEEAKASSVIDFYSRDGVKIIPRVGKKNIPHWACHDGSEFKREGSEMSLWHRNKQLAAHKNNCEVEYRLSTKFGLLIADAYDAKTNTLIEYVNTCYDENKIKIYFELGYNQLWVFKQKNNDYWNAHTYLKRYIILNYDLRDHKIEIPSIQVKYESE